MKIRIELTDGEEELILRCRALTPEIQKAANLLQSSLDTAPELCLSLAGFEYFVSPEKILFFETEDGKVTAHTAKHMYYAPYTLNALEAFLPSYFARASKSCLINVRCVLGVARNITGASEVSFRSSPKKVYVSRLYYKPFRQKLTLLRAIRDPSDENTKNESEKLQKGIRL